MKKMYFVLSLLLFAFSSCSDDENSSVRQAKQSDKEVSFVQAGGVAYVDAEGKNWWLNAISAVDNDGQTAKYELTSAEKKEFAETGKFEAVCGWLTVKCENNRIALTATENASANVRICEIAVQDEGGPYMIKGRQEGWLTGEPTDYIKLNPKEMRFGKDGGQSVATTEFPDWGIGVITIDEDYTIIKEAEYTKCFSEGVFDKTISWLTVRRDGLNLIITVAPNDTGKERKFCVSLSHYDEFQRLNGIQEE